MNIMTYIRRLLAYVIDWYLTDLLGIIIISIFASIMQKTIVIESNISELSASFEIIACILFILCTYAYFLLPHHLSKQWSGQTIGKKLMKVKVVDLHGLAPTSQALFIRTTFFLFVEQTFSSCSLCFRTVLALFIGNTLVTYLYCVCYVLSIVSIILMFFLKTHRQMLHDFIAKTQVIEKS